MLHIQQFIDRVQGCDIRNQRDFVMTLREAKDLHTDITKMMLELLKLKEVSQKPQEEVITVQMDGGSFKK